VAPNRHVGHLVGDPGAEAPVRQVVTHREEADPTGTSGTDAA
jgi:hypothetical protein